MSSGSTTVNLDDFKGALGSWAAGVTVVTTKTDGKEYGLTVSSFSSLSADPLLILVCIQNSNILADLVKESQTFAVTVLASDQEDISGFFAKSGREPVDSYSEFTTESWETGAPIFSGYIAALDCEVEELVPGGDHTILIGRVVGAKFDADKKPLIYFRRGYRDLVLD